MAGMAISGCRTGSLRSQGGRLVNEANARQGAGAGRAAHGGMAP